MHQVIIVVPVHKAFEALSQNERVSLRRLKDVLFKYRVCFIAPERLHVEAYLDYFENNDSKAERFPEQFFQSVKGYNRLLLNTVFYERFPSYDFMLIYQTDGFVFCDELPYWIGKGYDFIGAPFHTDNSEPFDANVWTVGNGGFSLRSINACNRLLKQIAGYIFFVRVLNKLGLKSIVIKALIKSGSRRLFYADGIMRNRYNEDYVFGVLSKKFSKGFNVAALPAALAFSFEAHPSELYKLNEQRLPFGCHGWDKYEPEFWERFIDEPTEVNNGSENFGA